MKIEDKKQYESPEISVIYLSGKDVIATSGGVDNGFDGDSDSF